MPATAVAGNTGGCEVPNRRETNTCHDGNEHPESSPRPSSGLPGWKPSTPNLDLGNRITWAALRPAIEETKPLPNHYNPTWAQ
jgi:hypothetical protein